MLMRLGISDDDARAKTFVGRIILFEILMGIKFQRINLASGLSIASRNTLFKRFKLSEVFLYFSAESISF
jgi:hypothetical protein